MQTCIIEIAYGAVAVVPSNRKPPAGLTCTVLEKVFRPVYYRLKRRSIIFVGKFSRRKCSCVDDKTFVLLHTGLTIFPVSCPKSVSQRDTAVSSQKRPKSVLDTDDPYHVACLKRCRVNGVVKFNMYSHSDGARNFYFKMGSNAPCNIDTCISYTNEATFATLKYRCH